MSRGRRNSPYGATATAGTTASDLSSVVIQQPKEEKEGDELADGNVSMDDMADNGSFG